MEESFLIRSSFIRKIKVKTNTSTNAKIHGKLSFTAPYQSRHTTVGVFHKLVTDGGIFWVGFDHFHECSVFAKRRRHTVGKRCQGVKLILGNKGWSQESLYGIAGFVDPKFQKGFGSCRCDFVTGLDCGAIFPERISPADGPLLSDFITALL